MRILTQSNRRLDVALKDTMFTDPTTVHDLKDENNTNSAYEKMASERDSDEPNPFTEPASRSLGSDESNSFTELANRSMGSDEPNSFTGPASRSMVLKDNSVEVMTIKRHLASRGMHLLGSCC
ncbi:hypothetical protein R6Q59_035505 [Mikania micrantha]